MPQVEMLYARFLFVFQSQIAFQTTPSTCATPCATAFSPGPCCSGSVKTCCTDFRRATTCSGCCCLLGICRSKCAEMLSVCLNFLSLTCARLQLRGIYGVQADGLLALAMGVGPAVITPTMSQEFLKCGSCSACSALCFSTATGLGCHGCIVVSALTLATGTTSAPRNSNQLPPKRCAPCLVSFTLVSPASSQVGPTTLAVRLLPQVKPPCCTVCCAVFTGIILASYACAIIVCGLVNGGV